MAEPNEPVAHLMRAAEELLLAAAGVLSISQERVRRSPGEPSGALSSVIGTALTAFSELAGEELLADLRRIVRAETARWEERAASDAAARRVRDIFAALLDVIAADEKAHTPGPPNRGRTARAPRRPASPAPR